MNIQDLLQFGGLKGSKVIAGAGGIDNEVTSVSVLEVADTRIKTWVLEKQLYITSFYAILQDFDMQKSVIQALHEKKAAGLVICHIDLFIKKIQPDIISLCNKLAFPLIIAKSERSYVDIINPILLKLSDEIDHDYHSIFDMQSKYIQNIATKKDVNAIFKTMSDEYHHDLFILDLNQNILYPKQHKDSRIIMDLAAEHDGFARENQNKEDFYTVELNQKNLIVYKIESNGLNFGTIIAEYSIDEMEKEIRMIRIFASLCTLILTKAARIEELETFKKQEYISDLITWNFRSDEVAIKTGQDVGWDITNKGIMVIINLNLIQENIGINSRDVDRLISEILYKKIKDIARADSKSNLLGIRSDIFMLLLEKDQRDIYKRAYNLGEKILDCCTEYYPGSVSIGISNLIDNYRKIPAAYHEAMEALRMGRNFLGVNQITSIKEIGFYGILRDFIDSEKFKNVKNNIFESLIQQDLEKGLDLYATLKTLIINNMNVEKAAKDLFLHKNTVNYRKNKIVEILGYEPWCMPHLFNTLLFIVSDFYS